MPRSETAKQLQRERKQEQREIAKERRKELATTVRRPALGKKLPLQELADGVAEQDRPQSGFSGFLLQRAMNSRTGDK